MNPKYLFRLHNNAIAMLQERGHILTKVENNFDNFREIFIKNDEVIYTDNRKIGLYIYKTDKVSFKKDNLTKLMKKLVNKKLIELTIVVSENIGKRLLSHNKLYPAIDIIYLNIKDICIHKTKHVKVPKHILIKDYKGDIKKKDMPLISPKDAISKWFSAKEGDVFKIERSNNSEIIDMSNMVILNTNLKESVLKLVGYQ